MTSLLEDAPSGLDDHGIHIVVTSPENESTNVWESGASDVHMPSLLQDILIAFEDHAVKIVITSPVNEPEVLWARGASVQHDQYNMIGCQCHKVLDRKYGYYACEYCYCWHRRYGKCEMITI